LGFLVVCNFDIQSPQHIVLNLNTIIGSPGPFMYTDLLSEDSKNNLQDELELLLPPCSAKVLMFNQDV